MCSFLKTSTKQVFYIATLVVLLAACTITGDRQINPLINVPSSFSLSGGSDLPDMWWHNFNDPVLNKLIEQALVDNPGLQSSWDRLSQAEAIARREGAGLIPSLDGSTSGLRNEVSNSKNDQTTLSLGLSASYELDIWGRIRSKRDAAVFDVSATREDLHAAAITLSAVVATRWYQLTEQYAQIETLNRQLQTNQQVLELVTLRFRQGRTNASDVLQQRQLVESNRSKIISAKSRARVIEHQLAVLVGRSPEEKIALPGSQLIDLPPLPATGLPSELIERRPDVRKAFYNVLSADSRLASAIANRFPRLNLSISGNSSAESVSNLMDIWTGSILANLLAPIIDGGNRKAEVDRNRAVLSQSLHEYGQVILDSLIEVENALVQEQRQKELIESIDKQLLLSKQVIQRVQDSYLNGAVDYLRILDTLITDQNLQRSQLEAKRRLIEFRIELCRALAGGWQLQRANLAKLENHR